MKKAAKPKRSAAWLKQHRHFMFLAGLHWDHEKLGAPRPVQPIFQDYARDLVIDAAAEGGVQVQSRTELSARQYGAAVTAIRSKMVKGGVYIPAKGKVTDPEGVKASVVFEMIAKLKTDFGYTEDNLRDLFQRQFGAPELDADNPAQVNKIHGALKGILRRLRQLQGAA